MNKPVGKIFLHLGFHKTGTTSLQVNIFPKLQGVYYLGRFHKSFKYGEQLYLNIMRYCCDTELNLDLRKLILIELNELLAKTDILISDEWLSSNYDGFYYGKGVNWVEKQQRLKDVLHGFDTRLLICTRTPVEAAFSMYCEYKQLPYGKKYKSFEQFCENSGDVLIYTLGKSYILKIWGNERVTCIDYAKLKEKPNEFENDIRIYFGGRLINKIGHENYKSNENEFVEIKSRGMLFIKTKDIIRNSSTLSKLILNNKSGKALLSVVINMLEKKKQIQKLSRAQKNHCLEILKSRKTQLYKDEAAK
jgi:hypothetical protein